MDTIILNALHRLECASEVYFSEVLIPTSTLKDIYK